jgi:TRAP-type transport system periplasmic protein
LKKAGARAEEEAFARFAEENEEDRKRQAEAGIQVIKFEGAVAQSYLEKAYEAGWAGVIRQSTEHGPKLRQFFSKPK